MYGLINIDISIHNDQRGFGAFRESIHHITSFSTNRATSLPPSLQSAAVVKNTCILFPHVVEPTLETEKVTPASMKAKEEQENLVPFLEQEIECPRCHDSMMLCSDFDNLYYVCQECDFCLYTVKKSTV